MTASPELNPGTPAATLDLIADLYRQAAGVEGEARGLRVALHEAAGRAERAEARCAELEAELAELRAAVTEMSPSTPTPGGSS